MGGSFGSTWPFKLGSAWGGAASLLAATMLFAFGYFLLSATLMAAVPRLKRGEPMWQLASTVSDYRWVGLAYAGSASVATLLFLTYRQSGIAVLMVMVPLVVVARWVLLSSDFFSSVESVHLLGGEPCHFSLDFLDLVVQKVGSGRVVRVRVHVSSVSSQAVIGFYVQQHNQ